jgi:hypothetical protein
MPDLKDWQGHFSAFNVAAGSAEPKTAIPLAAPPMYGFGFTLTNKTVEVVSDNLDETLKPQLLVPTSANAVFFFHEQPLGAVQSDVDDNIPADALYAGARALLQNDNIAEALDVLSVRGDVRFVDEISNSFTTAEYGQVESSLMEAVYTEGARFVKGCQPASPRLRCCSRVSASIA